MSNIFSTSLFFGVFISIVGYGIGVLLKKKFQLGVFNPLMISIIVVMVVLVVTKVPYKKYYDGAKYLSYLLTPATVCLAIPLYQQMNMLKKNYKAVMGGILAGVLTSLCTVLVFSLAFHFTHKEYVTLLPKSITTAIGMGVSDELGGIVTITVAVIIITGVFGNIIAEIVFKVFKIEESVARGIALGTSAHAIGTAKAMEFGEVEGAMSSLAIAVAGLITVVGASIFANFM